MKKIIDIIVIIVIIIQIIIVYTVGPILGLLQLLIWIGLIKIIHPERFPHRKGKIIVVFNHPSLLEPFLIACLFWQSYLRHPLKLAPVAVIDKINMRKKDFFGSRWLYWIRPFCIPVDRKNGNNKNAIEQMIKVLEKGKILIWSPEGGRTSTGGKLQYDKTKKHCIRKKLKPTGALLAQTTGAEIFPIWFGWKKIKNNRFPIIDLLMGRLTIKIGGMITVEKNEDKKIATQRISNALLELSDE